MSALEKTQRTRRGTIFAMGDPNDEAAELRSELVIAQNMNKRLMHKERRMQVQNSAFAHSFRIFCLRYCSVASLHNYKCFAWFSFLFAQQELCQEWERKNNGDKTFPDFYRAVRAVAFSTGTRLKTRVQMVSKVGNSCQSFFYKHQNYFHILIKLTTAN